MIDYQAGVSIQSLLKQSGVNITFQTNNIAALYGGVDAAGRLVEVGWEKYPTLMVLTWEAQWINFVAELARNLSEPALVIPVMDRLDMQGEFFFRVLLNVKGNNGAVSNINIDPSLYVW